MFSNELWHKSDTTTYSIDQSIRFNSADTAYMHRTPSSTGNRKTFTSSFWVKLGKLGVNTALPMPGVTHGIGSSSLYLTTANVLNAYMYYNGSWSGLLIGTRVFRDPSAWYHFVIVVDTTDSTASERIRIYVNGQRETNFSSEAYPTQNTDTDWNLSGEKMWIGIDPSGSGYNGEYYASEMVYIDGQALDPSSFGETTSDGIWVPKDVSGLTFGTNGFYIDGRDSADLGDDESGSGNDLTTSGLASHDQVADSPTNNFNTMNPLNPLNGGALSQGNLTNVLSGDDQFYTTQELGFKSYCEVRVDAQSNYGGTLGLGTFGGDDDDNTLVFQTNYLSGYIWLNGGNASANIGGTITTGDIVMMAYDPTTRKWWVGVNGTWRNSGDPANGTGQVYQHSTTDFGEGIGAIVWSGWKGSANGLTVTWNFGQDGTFAGQETAGGNSDGNGVGNFKYSVPSGFLANCTKNLGS